ncbi:hypothetical protein T11_15599 [Trichinella zimbabwensis]|uniref:Uncharacterized protein n=1 Tax=Trichinella zimbabwensis TaxID=268475 RepID=A0A0V1GHE7_9BILA|nr:hypothetical protein T11_15599 [Trichinella zimbabwensis]
MGGRNSVLIPTHTDLTYTRAHLLYPNIIFQAV